MSAKAYIDRRVLLESQRLLAHTDAGTAQIAAALGFSEATNFIKFFQRATRQTPSAFRARSRA
jgi:AraC-like DNA-binding protein